MPFTCEERPVAVVTQHLSQGDLRGTQIAFVLSGQVAVLAASATPSLARRVPDPGGDSVVRWILAGKYTGSRGTANLTGGVTARELHPLVSYAVDVRTLVIG